MSAFISASEAARIKGLSVQAITDAIKKGRLTAEYDDQRKRYKINIAELERTYPDKKAKKEEGEGSSDINTINNAAEVKALERECELLKDQVRDKNTIIDDIRKERDEWREEAKTIRYFLPKPEESKQKNNSNSFTIAAIVATLVVISSVLIFKGSEIKTTLSQLIQ